MFHWRKGYPYEFSAHVPMLLRWPETWLRSQRPGPIVERGTVLQPPVVTELRDVFHTLVDAAGVASNASLVPPQGSAGGRGGRVAFDARDGKSMLCLLRDPSGLKHCDYAPNPGPWRKWIDLEHSTVYNNSNHWSALTDGRVKYIFNAFSGTEELFDLTVDPDETVNVALSQEYLAELKLWRSRMVKQFEEEQRGDKWVKDGVLAKRRQGTVYSPHYPRSYPPRRSTGDAANADHPEMVVLFA